MMGNGDWQRAASFLNRRIKDHPRDYRLLYQHGVALESALQTDKAIEAFTRMLAVKKKLKRGGRKQQSPALSGCLGPLQKLVPNGTVRLIQLQRASHRAYRYQNRNRCRMMRGTGVGRGVTLPGNVDQARRFALAHLQKLAAQLSGKRRKRLIQRAEQAGMRLASVLFRMQPGGNFGQLAPRLLEKHGDDPAIAALGVFAASLQQTQVSLDQLKQWHKLCLRRIGHNWRSWPPWPPRDTARPATSCSKRACPRLKPLISPTW